MNCCRYCAYSSIWSREMKLAGIQRCSLPARTASLSIRLQILLGPGSWSGPFVGMVRNVAIGRWSDPWCIESSTWQLTRCCAKVVDRKVRSRVEPVGLFSLRRHVVNPGGVVSSSLA